MAKTNITKRTSARTGKVTYQIRIRRAGMPSITRTYANQKEAEAERDSNHSKLFKGESLLTTEARKITVDEAIDDYLQNSESRIKGDRERATLEKLKNEFRGLGLQNLTPPKLEKWVQALLDTPIPAPATKLKTHKLYQGDSERTYSESSVRKYFYALKKALEWHTAFRRIPWQSPFLIVKAPTEDNDRTRRFEDGEEARLLAACDQKYVKGEDMKRIIQFATEAAMRAQEILKMRWTDIDFSKRQITIPRHHAKTKREREVPLTTVAVQILKKHEATRTPNESRVFWQWQSSDTLGHAFKVVCKNAGLLDFRFHDLRHEATSRFYERTSLTDVQIAKITGHSEMTTLKRYANIRSENLAAKLW